MQTKSNAPRTAFCAGAAICLRHLRYCFGREQMGSSLRLILTGVFSISAWLHQENNDLAQVIAWLQPVASISP